MSAACSLLLATLIAAGPAPVDWAALARQAPTKEQVTSSKKLHGIDGIRGATASFIVAAPRDVALDTLWDVEAFPEIFPDIDQMKVLRKAPTRIDVHFAVNAVVTDAEYTLRRRLDRNAGTIRWREIGEGDVKHIRGEWRVEAVGAPGYSRVVYSSYVDVGFFVPTSAVRDLAIRKIDEMAGRVRGAVAKRAARAQKSAELKSGAQHPAPSASPEAQTRARPQASPSAASPPPGATPAPPPSP